MGVAALCPHLLSRNADLPGFQGKELAWDVRRYREGKMEREAPKRGASAWL